MSRYRPRSTTKNYRRVTLSLSLSTDAALRKIAEARDMTYSHIVDKVLAAFCQRQA